MGRRTRKAGIETGTGFGLRSFSLDDVEALHFATLEVLRDVGIKVVSEEAAEILHSGGAKVKRINGGHLVRFPNYLVEDCIRWAPRSIMFHGRRPEDDYAADSKRVGFSPFGECIKIIDYKTQEVRSTTLKDLEEATRLCDYLDEIVLVERTMGALEKNPQTQPLHNYRAMVNNTSKHCILGFGSLENTAMIIEMAAICSGGRAQLEDRPIVSAFVCPTSPLVLGQSCCDVTIECAQAGLGIASISMVLTGATAPASLAGTMVIHNSEVLGNLVLSQLTRKGASFTYATCTTIMDLKTSVAAVGAPEYGILSAGLTRLANYYKIPCWAGGGLTDSKLPDAQAAYESGLSAALTALGGANFVYGAGGLESGLTFDFAKLIMDAEQIRRINRVIEGIVISDESIAIDIIKSVVPGGGFIALDHTFDHMLELSSTLLFDRRNREKWLKKTGGKNLTERAYEEAERILTTHQVMPLPDGADAAMQQLIADYEAELAPKR